jgi:hypothetical protein
VKAREEAAVSNVTAPTQTQEEHKNVKICSFNYEAISSFSDKQKLKNLITTRHVYRKC